MHIIEIEMLIKGCFWFRRRRQPVEKRGPNHGLGHDQRSAGPNGRAHPEAQPPQPAPAKEELAGRAVPATLLNATRRKRRGTQPTFSTFYYYHQNHKPTICLTLINPLILLSDDSKVLDESNRATNESLLTIE